MRERRVRERERERKAGERERRVRERRGGEGRRCEGGVNKCDDNGEKGVGVINVMMWVGRGRI